MTFNFQNSIGLNLLSNADAAVFSYSSMSFNNKNDNDDDDTRKQEHHSMMQRNHQPMRMATR